MSAAHQSLGLIGLGTVGFRLARRLLQIEAASPLHVLDCDLKKKGSRSVALGAQASSDAKTLATQADVILISLPSPASVEEVMMGEKGLISGIKPGTVILDLSTLDPDTSRIWQTTSRSATAIISTPRLRVQLHVAEAPPPLAASSRFSSDNARKQEGFTRLQYTHTHKSLRRCSSAYAYLRPARHRPNLKIITRARNPDHVGAR